MMFALPQIVPVDESGRTACPGVGMESGRQKPAPRHKWNTCTSVDAGIGRLRRV
jgi:hypothetical protein